MDGLPTQREKKSHEKECISELSQISRLTLGISFFLFLTPIYSRRINQLPECQALCQTLGKGYGAKPRGASCCHRVY